jgi:hypothetical protein
MGPAGTSTYVCVFKHRFGPLLHFKSHIFVCSTLGKGNSLFYLLTKTTTNQAGDFVSPAFFMADKQ